MAVTERAGIQRTALFAAFHSDYAGCQPRSSPDREQPAGRFYGFAFVHAGHDRGRVGRLVEVAVERHGFVGVKVHRHDARITREVCAVAAAYGLPVNCDVMGEVSIVRLLAEEYPQVAFIIPHLGSFADDWAAQVTFLDHLARYPNIYTDTSGVRRFDLLEEAIARAGSQKVLFGSDGPWLHPGLELAKVRALRLLPADEALSWAATFCA